MNFAREDLGGFAQLSAFGVESARTGLELGQLAQRGFAVGDQGAHLIARLAGHPLRLLGVVTGESHRLARLGLRLRARRQLALGLGDQPLQLVALGRGRGEIPVDAAAGFASLTPLVFGPLAAFHGVPVPFAGDRDLRAQRLDRLAHGARFTRPFVPVRIAGGALVMRRIARGFRLPDALLRLGHRRAQVGELHLELGQLLPPRGHVAGGQREVDREAPLHELRVALGTLALPGQGADLALHLAEQVVQPRQVLRGLVEATLGVAPAVAIEAYARSLLEQFPPVVGTVGEQRVDHPLLDDDAGVRAQPRAPHQVVNVAEATRGAVEQVVALTRP